MKLKLPVLAVLLASLALAQPYTGIFSGTHSFGDYQNPYCSTTGTAGQPYPAGSGGEPADNPNGETNCVYVEQPGQGLGSDPNAAYAYLTDTTGVQFPTINPRETPPTINQTGPWNIQSLAWDDGTMRPPFPFITGVGTCTATGGPVSGTQADYTVQCQGTDSNGNPVSKIHHYNVYKTGRFGGFWQPPSDALPVATVTFTVQ